MTLPTGRIVIAPVTDEWMNEYAGLVEMFVQGKTEVLSKRTCPSATVWRKFRTDWPDRRQLYAWATAGPYVGHFLLEYVVSFQKTVSFITTAMRTSPAPSSPLFTCSTRICEETTHSPARCCCCTNTALVTEYYQHLMFFVPGLLNFWYSAELQ